jgi:hemerythrin-like domain-containing protein
MESLLSRLEHEHRAILDAIDAFSRFLKAAEADPGSVDASDLARFVLFFREYVDLIHHEREERVLLPALVRHDFSPTAGPLAYVREQHSRERQLLHELVALCFRRGGCRPTDPQLVLAAEAFIAFQRVHIEQEATRLYPVARTVLRNEHSRLRAEQARFDAEHEAYERSAWLERLLGELAAVYLPTPNRRSSIAPPLRAP